MRRSLQLTGLCILGVACVESATPAQSKEIPVVATPVESAPDARTLPAEQSALLDAWFEKIGPRRAKESFGSLVVRAARVQLGKEYYDPPQKAQPESLRVRLETFQCVSFVESTLAVARCTWTGKQDSDCFLQELETFRYRGGTMDGYPSRLHYFTDWIRDNSSRRRLQPASAMLGGQPERFAFDYMSKHPKKYPAMASPAVAAAIEAEEERLSAVPHIIVDRDTAKRTQGDLQPGDLVAIVSTKYPGLLIRHAGFVDLNVAGKPRLLHASSHHKRVMIHAVSVAGYLAAIPDRRGMMVARPLAP